MVLYGKEKIKIVKLIKILKKICIVLYFQKRVKKLRKRIINYNYKYYVLNNQDIPDYQYDKLLLKLKKIESLFPYLRNKKSPTQIVGEKTLINFKKINHKIPMLSLNNVFDKKSLLKNFLYPLKIKFNKQNFCCELKFDGIAISLLYKNGLLIRGATRGNGITGDNVTHNILKIKEIPHKLKGTNFPFLLEVRGEIFITKKNFSVLNKLQFSINKKFCNTRSAAVGLLRLNNNINNKTIKLLSFFSYGIGFSKKLNIFSQNKILQRLKSYGLPVSNYSKIYFSFSKIQNFYNYFQKNRNFLPYVIDGIVIKIDSIKIQNILGCTAHAPKWAIAYKFPSQEKITFLQKVIFQIGRTGIVTPIAKFNTVNISGNNINYATLYNTNEIKKLNLKIGDMIIVQRCGDVIPKIINVVIEKRFFNKVEDVILPKKCPSCNNLLKKNKNNILYCSVGFFCKDQLKGYLKHFISRNAININYIGDKLIDKLVEKNFVKNLLDLFKINYTTLVKIDTLGEKLIQKILKSLKEEKIVTFDRFLFSLGIPEVGIVSSYNLSHFFKTIDNFLNTNLIELSNIPGIGTKISLNILNYINNKNNVDTIKNLLKEINIIYPKILIEKNYFYGKRVTITGKLFFIKRFELIKKLRLLGSNIDNNIKKNTDILILGKKPSSKLLRANKLNIKIINENVLLKLLSEK
ncbi:NAD-dependent DNA ligase LigA [Enterobacteriaceae endosymbiont of Donacia tomentosa]|uniref:NAD-dependent DNA ligase LigA n=1 Tax=Enterobacteriaceae endosymbiont of Donacia tomentosa TaxID=2675787 RepID=UPI00144953D6|nr:NAD-dependent DNA ligase LigA [Enterobacteriaceae endosymbiont of Donacia tomentosa]QJC31494.1 NAD-dependent DNA ligase LigA [Enterobacteriaceae endosymbiont of Donacia tomentosa]